MSRAAGSELSVPQRIWAGLLGGAAYRRLTTDSPRVYPAFFLVALFTAVVASVLVAVTASQGLRAVAAIWPELPSFRITQGTLVLPPGTHIPVRISDGRASVVLDPSAGPSSDPLGSARYGLAIGASSLVIRPGPLAGSDRVLPLSMLGQATLDRSQLGAELLQLERVGIWLGALLNVVYSVLRDLVRAAVLAWTGLVAARLSRRSLSWPEAWRVGLACWTLPMIAEVASPLIGLPSWSLWLVALVYAIMGVLAVEAS